MKVRIPQQNSQADMMRKLQQFQENSAKLEEELSEKEYDVTSLVPLIFTLTAPPPEVTSYSFSLSSSSSFAEFSWNCCSLRIISAWEFC